MKKIRLLSISLLLGVLLFALTACGGAGGAVSGFVNAVKKGDEEKAKTFTTAPVDLSYDKEDEVAAYMWKKTVGSFSYKVEEETEKKNDEGEVTSVEIKISYEKYSQIELAAKMAGNTSIGDIGGLFTGDKKYTKKDVDEAMKELEKKSDTITVTVAVDEEGEWKLDTVSGAALLVVLVA